MKNLMSCFLILTFALISFAGTDESASTATTASSGIEKGNVDSTVRPQDDFYRYVNNNWLKKTSIPPDKSTFGASIILIDEAQEQLKSIVEEVSGKQAQNGTEEQKVGDFYKSFMDQAKLEELGKKPLDPYLKEIEEVQDKEALAAWFGRAQQLSVTGPIRFFIELDEKDVTKYIGYFYQSGLGLPDRDYYFKEDEKNNALRAAYKKHIETMFTLAGWPDPAGSAQRIYALEEKLAKGHWTRVENRDPQKTYNKFEITKLQSLGTDFPWKTFVDNLGIKNESAVVVAQPPYLTVFNEALKSNPLDDWKLYAKWHLLSDVAPYLSSAFEKENFNFYQKTIRGVPEQQERWKLAIQNIDALLGESVGKIYVQRHFPPAAKAQMENLVKNLLLAYGQSIDQLDWMTPETKKQAKEKLSKFTYKIGYPDRWRDYSALKIQADDLIGNVERAVVFEYQRNLNKLGKPVDKTEWGMTPQTVNAYYNPVMNEIVFPAAILQPPYFNMNAEDAVNYGGIGGVIGHEIGHGFDDQGSQYDGAGNLRNWWSDQDRKEFENRTGRLVDQYNKFEPIPGEHVNGKLTLGENIGDLGGLSIAYKAYQLSLKGKSSPVIDGLTGDQRFFMGWAQVWPRLYRDEELRRRLVVDPHSPSEYRCNGIVRNIPEFYSAFGVKEGDKMYLKPEERVKIW